MGAMNLRNQRLSLLAVFSMACLGCTTPVRSETDGVPGARIWRTPPGRVPVAMPIHGPIEGQRTYGVPYPLPGHNTWLASFVITKAKAWYRDGDPFAEGGLAASGASSTTADSEISLREAPIRWHNAAFVDRKTGAHWSLLEDRGFLSRWWVLLEERDGIPVSRIMLFAATLSDTNGDGYLDDEDAAVALLTTGDGHNATVVTPPDAQLHAVHYYAEEDLLVFELRIDADGDGHFDIEDPLRTYILPRDSETKMAIPWLDPKAQSELEALYR